MTLNVQATAYTGLGPGPHAVHVTGIERKVAKAGGDYFRWEFTDPTGSVASANTSADLTPGNKTGKWYSALTGKVVQVGGNYSLADCIGKPADIFIELNQEGFPKVISVTARQTHAQASNTTEQVLASERQKAAEQHAIQEGDELPF